MLLCSCAKFFGTTAMSADGVECQQQASCNAAGSMGVLDRRCRLDGGSSRRLACSWVSNAVDLAGIFGGRPARPPGAIGNGVSFRCPSISRWHCNVPTMCPHSPPLQKHSQQQSGSCLGERMTAVRLRKKYVSLLQSKPRLPSRLVFMIPCFVQRFSNSRESSPLARNMSTKASALSGGTASFVCAESRCKTLYWVRTPLVIGTMLRPCVRTYAFRMCSAVGNCILIAPVLMHLPLPRSKSGLVLSTGRGAE